MKNAPNKRIGDSWTWRAFYQLFVRYSAVARAENTLLNNRIKISTFCSFTVQTFRQKVINCPAIANAWTLGAISQSPLFIRAWQNSLFGFDNNSQAFFSSDNFYLTSFWKHFRMTEKIFYGFGWDKNFESADKQKINISILLDKKTVFIFHVRHIFLTETFSQFEKLFLTQRRWRQFFHLFIFRFDQTMGLFFLWTQIFNSMKNDKSFFGQKKFENFFRWTTEFVK